MKRQNVTTIKNANTKKQKQEIVSELPSVDYFEVFLEKVRALEVRNELARKIENDPIFHNQTFLGEKVKQKLLEFNKIDVQLAAGICHAISLMRDTCALSHLKEDKTLFLTGLKLIICHNPPEDDFSDLILSFYKVARYIQIDAFAKLNCNDLHIIESIKRRGTPKIYNTITLPVLLTADELKRLFHVLTTDPAYWKNSNATFLLTTNQHTTTGEYEHDEKVFSYLDSNARKEKVIVPEDDEPSTPANIDELYDEVKQALCVGNYKNFDESNPNSYLPIYFSTFNHNK